VVTHDKLCPAEDYGIPYLCLCELIATARADECGINSSLAEVIVDDYRTGLRARVKALRHEDSCAADMSAIPGRCICLRGDVLALLDGATDD
jgi:hypothetical protein